MLPKSERLKKSSEFSAVYNQKRSVANSLLILYTGRKKTSADIATKVGFVVAKKISKKATRRNRIKRLMREAYRNIRKNENINPEWQRLIFIARAGMLEINYKQVYDAIVDCLKKAQKRYGQQQI